MEDRNVCWLCGEQLTWQSDCDLEDIGEEGNGVVSILNCYSCGAEVRYIKRE